jgi:tetratricopeptide (TPR) repeat protein
LTGIIGEERALTDQAALRDLARVCDYLPLALRIVASQLASSPHHSVRSLADTLASGDRLSALTIDNDEQAAVRSAFDQSYRTLGPDVARLFRVLSEVPGSRFDQYVAANLTGWTTAKAQATLERLVRANLLEQTDAGTFQLHDLIREYARRQAEAHDSPESLTQARRRLFEYYMFTANRATSLLHSNDPRLAKPAVLDDMVAPPLASALAARDWLDAEAGNLFAAICDERSIRSDFPVWLLADAMRGYYDRQDFDQARSTALAVALRAARTAGDRPGETAMRLALAQFQHLRGQYREAAKGYAVVADAAHALGDAVTEGRCLNGQGNAAFQWQDYSGAANLYRIASAALRDAGDHAGEAIAITNLGTVLVMVGDSTAGLEQLNTAREIAEHRGFSNVLAQALSIIAMDHAWAGRHDQAADGFDSALRIWRHLGNRQGEAQTLRNIAEIHLELGHPKTAARRARQALGVARTVGVLWMEAGARTSLGHALLCVGQPDEARTELEAALRIATKRVRYWYTPALLGLAECHRLRGNLRAALDVASAGIADPRPRYQGRAYAAVGKIYLALDRAACAIGHAQTALEIAQRHRYRYDEGEAKKLLTNARRCSNDAPVPGGRPVRVER